MTKLTSNIGLKKGDSILMVEVCPISQGTGTQNQQVIDTTFEHKFEIARVNPKTYTCKYMEGAYKGSGFRWIKTDNIAGEKEYYLIEE